MNISLFTGLALITIIVSLAAALVIVALAAVIVIIIIKRRSRENESSIDIQMQPPSLVFEEAVTDVEIGPLLSSGK